MMLSIPVIVIFVAPVFSDGVTLHGRFMPMNEKYSITNPNLWSTKYGPSPSFAIKRNTHSLARQGKSYDDTPVPADPESVDLHNGEFCVDVSVFGPVIYDKKAVKVCDSSFVKQCEDRSEQVMLKMLYLQ